MTGLPHLEALPAALKALLILLLLSGLVAGGFRRGYAFFLGALFAACVFGQDLETFANVLNQGATGTPTLRLILALGALAWLGEVLKEAGALERLGRGLGALSGDPRGRGVALSSLAGLLPGEDAAAASSACTRGMPLDDARRGALHHWFRRLAALALPVGAGFLLASELGGLSLLRATSLLLPLALALGALGLLFLARDLPESVSGEAPGPGSPGWKRDLASALLPGAIALAVAFLLPDTRIPVVRSAQPAWRILEGLLGLASPLTLGAVLGALLAARFAEAGNARALSALRRAFRTDLVVFAVGLQVFRQVLAAGPGAEVARALPLPQEAMLLVFLTLPALMAFLLGGAAEGLVATLPFLFAGVIPEPLLVAACAGAFLGESLSGASLAPLQGEGKFQATAADLRWQLALPSGLAVLLAAALTLL